jgi:hypothetical protein
MPDCDISVDGIAAATDADHATAVLTIFNQDAGRLSPLEESCCENNTERVEVSKVKATASQRQRAPFRFNSCVCNGTT